MITEPSVQRSAQKQVSGFFAGLVAPAVISASRILADVTSGPTKVAWFDTWTPTLDQALDTLPTILGCEHDVYRELTQPSEAVKRHALVTEHGQPTAVISLRSRRRYWEPVTYQALPGVIAPAASPAALGRALRALGVEVRIEAGMDADVRDLNPTSVYSYDVRKVLLQEDYESVWSSNHRKNVRRARKRCEFLDTRINSEEDLEWCVEQWRRMWQGDDDQEIVAAQDRLRCWRALYSRQGSNSRLRMHTVHLIDGSRHAAGLVLISCDDIVLAQCIARAPEYDQHWAGVRAMDASIAWAANAGYRIFDLGGGNDYKKSWGESLGERHGAIFRPKAIGALYKLGLK